MKTLVVVYRPRGDRSRTGALADHAGALLKKRGVTVDVLDVGQDVPDLLTPGKLAAYYRRNYAGETLTPAETALLKGVDRMASQLTGADSLVVAYPMYNFSQPAIVKAWFDAVMQKGLTWDIGPSGYAGLMKGRKALVITSSGGVYEGDMAPWDHSSGLTQTQLSFMGYNVAVVKAAGLNRFPEKEPEIMAHAREGIETALSSWA